MFGIGEKFGWISRKIDKALIKLNQILYLVEKLQEQEPETKHDYIVYLDDSCVSVKGVTDISSNYAGVFFFRDSDILAKFPIDTPYVMVESEKEEEPEDKFYVYYGIDDFALCFGKYRYKCFPYSIDKGAVRFNLETLVRWLNSMIDEM